MRRLPAIPGDEQMRVAVLVKIDLSSVSRELRPDARPNTDTRSSGSAGWTLTAMSRVRGCRASPCTPGTAAAALSSSRGQPAPMPEGNQKNEDVKDWPQAGHCRCRGG